MFHIHLIHITWGYFFTIFLLILHMKQSQGVTTQPPMWTIYGHLASPSFLTEFVTDKQSHLFTHKYLTVKKYEILLMQWKIMCFGVEFSTCNILSLLKKFQNLEHFGLGMLSLYCFLHSHPLLMIEFPPYFHIQFP